MSYKLDVLSHSPLAFWPLESVYSSGLLTYQDLLDDYATYTQFLNGFDTYAESSGTITEDISGSKSSIFTQILLVLSRFVLSPT